MSAVCTGRKEANAQCLPFLERGIANTQHTRNAFESVAVTIVPGATNHIVVYEMICTIYWFQVIFVTKFGQRWWLWSRQSRGDMTNPRDKFAYETDISSQTQAKLDAILPTISMHANILTAMIARKYIIKAVVRVTEDITFAAKGAWNLLEGFLAAPTHVCLPWFVHLLSMPVICRMATGAEHLHG